MNSKISFCSIYRLIQDQENIIYELVYTQKQLAISMNLTTKRNEMKQCFTFDSTKAN